VVCAGGSVLLGVLGSVGSALWMGNIGKGCIAYHLYTNLLDLRRTRLHVSLSLQFIAECSASILDQQPEASEVPSSGIHNLRTVPSCQSLCVGCFNLRGTHSMCDGRIFAWEAHRAHRSAWVPVAVTGSLLGLPMHSDRWFVGVHDWLARIKTVSHYRNWGMEGGL